MLFFPFLKLDNKNLKKINGINFWVNMKNELKPKQS